ncbi:MAG TPA: hypothetical protein VGB37_14860 [Candidatus Lokiarchaeia archaeon]
MTNIKEKLSPEFDDLIKTLQFPDKFYNILDKISHDEFNRGYGIGAKNEQLVILHKIDKLIGVKRIKEKIEETKEPKSEWAMLRAGDVHEREKLELLEELKKEIEKQEDISEEEYDSLQGREENENI